MQNSIEFYPLIFLYIRGEWVFSFLFKDDIAHPHWKKKKITEAIFLLLPQ